MIASEVPGVRSCCTTDPLVAKDRSQPPDQGTQLLFRSLQSFPQGFCDPQCCQPADFSSMRSSTALGMVLSKSSSLAQVGVIVMTTISS